MVQVQKPDASAELKRVRKGVGIVLHAATESTLYSLAEVSETPTRDPHAYKGQNLGSREPEGFEKRAPQVSLAEMRANPALKQK